MNRRDFFRRLGNVEAAIRPPWAKPESGFADACDGCGACIEACPQAILIPKTGGRPVVDVSNTGCTFCGKCADVCTRGAFLDPREGRPWRLAATVSEGCLEHQGVSCRVCETSCEAEAIRFRPALGGRSEVIIDFGQCTGCGACVSSCPIGAIRLQDSEEVRREHLRRSGSCAS